MYTLLAIQVVLEMGPTGPLRERLRGLLRSVPEQESYNGKHRFYEAVTRALLEARDHFARGVWDYVEDPGKAEAEYRSWREGTVVDAREEGLEEAERFVGEPAPAAGGGPDRRYMFVTLLFLLQQGGHSDRHVCELCRVPESELWRRATFVRLLEGLSSLSFANVREDMIFMRPGLGELGVPAATLDEEHYQHLRRLG